MIWQTKLYIHNQKNDFHPSEIQEIRKRRRILMTDFSYANTSFTRNSRNRTRKSRRREKASRGSCTALRTTRDTDRSRVVPFPPLTLCICVCMHTERGARGEAWERARERPKVTTHVGGRSAFRTRTRKADGCLYTYRLILREKEPLRRGYTHIRTYTRKRDRQQIRI